MLNRKNCSPNLFVPNIWGNNFHSESNKSRPDSANDINDSNKTINQMKSFFESETSSKEKFHGNMLFPEKNKIKNCNSDQFKPLLPMNNFHLKSSLHNERGLQKPVRCYHEMFENSWRPPLNHPIYQNYASQQQSDDYHLVKFYESECRISSKSDQNIMKNVANFSNAVVETNKEENKKRQTKVNLEKLNKSQSSKDIIKTQKSNTRLDSSSKVHLRPSSTTSNTSQISTSVPRKLESSIKLKTCSSAKANFHTSTQQHPQNVKPKSRTKDITGTASKNSVCNTKRRCLSSTVKSKASVEDECNEDEECCGEECFEEMSASEEESDGSDTDNGKERNVVSSMLNTPTKKFLMNNFFKSSTFIQSSFVKVPPTIRFVSEPRPENKEFKKFMKVFKWRMSSITPTVVRNCVVNSGFSFTNRTNAWLGTWCRNIKTPLYKNIKDYQKFNHFPAIYQIGRKDHLHRNISRMVNNFGSEHFGFTPQTFILPAGMKAFLAAWKANTCKKWIIKPPASARGLGIKVVSKVDDALVSRIIIIQKYISNPYLIDGSKFDMRIYVYVTCFNPLRVYVCRNGLARFATAKYSNKQNSLKNRFVHLTNYSINKKNSELEVIDSSDAAIGCNQYKWSLVALWSYLDKKGVSSKMVWESIKDIVVKTIISSETHIRNLTSLNTKNPYCCHELLGFDVLLDQNLKTWLLEVNISPSLHSSTELDRGVKEPMVVDILNTAGYRIPESFDLLSSGNKHVDWSTYTPSNHVCMDKRFHNRKLSHEDKEKHIIYQQAFLEQRTIQLSILEKLTSNDLKVLIDTIDERKRCGQLEIIYPNRTTVCYLKYFDNPHYYNLLVQAWCIKYPDNDADGLAMLNKYCWHELHLKTISSSHDST